MKMRPFQLGLLAFFAVLAVVALVLLSNYSPDRNSETAVFDGGITVWGTYDEGAMRRVMGEIAEIMPGFENVSYSQKDERTIDTELLTALAEDRAPDLVLAPASQLTKMRSKIQPIPPETFPVRDFKDAYVDAADVYLLSDGLYALPLALDPLIMFWNRDMFASKGIAEPPQTWEGIVDSIVPTFTERDSRRTIFTSAVAFGEAQNVKHMRSIMSALTLQSGSRMVVERGDGMYTVGLNDNLVDQGRPPLVAALQFYTDFSNPNSPLYSWNRSLALDEQAFIAGDLALYFAPGSEAAVLARKNPNLNFDVAPLPQGAGATIRRTHADVIGFSVLRASRNKVGAYQAAQIMTSATYAGRFAEALAMTPVRRSLVGARDLDQYERVSYESALFARDWLSPGSDVVNEVFTTMIEDVTSNRSRPEAAVNDAVGRLKLAY
jgi:ABC-type glycerol-3-phosphate transport system substrate-binding protein